MSEVSDYYDQYSAKQQRKGINHRHLSILRYLEKFGLTADMQVLEIGSGIGTVTELILRNLDQQGSLMATDISAQSIEILKNRLAKYNNISAKVHNFTESKVDQQFDLIVLPDVIEHIPLEQHPSLFKHISQMLKANGSVFIHIPDPNHLEMDIVCNPDNLQIIDQPIHTKILGDSLVGTDLYIHYLESYSIYAKPADYQAVLLKKIPSHDSYKERPNYLNDSLPRKVLKKFKYLLRGRK